MMLRNTIFGSALLGLAACAEPGVVPYQAPAADARVLRDIRITGTTIDVSALGEFTRGRQVSTVEVLEALEDAAVLDMRYNVGNRPVTARVVVMDVDLGSELGFLGEGTNTMVGTAALLDATTGAPIAPPVEVRARFNAGVNTVEGGIDGADFRGDDAAVLDLARQFIERARQLLVGA